MLTVVVEAHDLGAVIGKGAHISNNNQMLTPDVIFVPNRDRKIVKPEAIFGAPALAIDVLNSRVAEPAKAALRSKYAAAGVPEYWQIDADRTEPHFYQADANGHYEAIPADARGLYYASAMVELAFPVEWFRKQPNLLTLMEWWGLIDVEED